MPQSDSSFRKLMETDVTLPLAVVVLVLGGVGFFYGPGAALRTLGYGFLALLALGVPLMLLYARHAELEHLRGIQEMYGGQLRRGWPGRGPSLDFTYAGSRARVRLVRRSQRYRPDDVQVEVDWTGSPVRLEVHPQGVLSMLGRMVGLQEIAVGRSSFDDIYVVRGDNPDQVRRLLTLEVQRRIEALPEQKYLAVRLDEMQLVVRAQHYSLQSDIVGFTEAALRLYDGLRQSDTA